MSSLLRYDCGHIYYSTQLVLGSWVLQSFMDEVRRMWRFLKMACKPGFTLILGPGHPGCYSYNSGGLQPLWITGNTKLQVWTQLFLPLKTALLLSEDSRRSREKKTYLNSGKILSNHMPDALIEEHIYMYWVTHYFIFYIFNAACTIKTISSSRVSLLATAAMSSLVWCWLQCYFKMFSATCGPYKQISLKEICSRLIYTVAFTGLLEGTTAGKLSILLVFLESSFI